MLALINTSYVYEWEGQNECFYLLIRRVCVGSRERVLALSNTPWVCGNERFIACTK